MKVHNFSVLSVVLACSLAFAAPENPAMKMDVKQGGAIGDGAADDTAAIQKALTGGQRTVVIPPGTYRIRAALKVDSGTTIQAAPNAIIRLGDGAGTNAGVFLLTNRDPAGGNTNITVEGGIWDGNNEHNPRGRDGDLNGYTGTAINFVNVRHLALRNLTIRNPDAFSIRLGEVEDFVVEDIRFDHTRIRPNQDGVHVGGFCQRGVIRKLRALTPRTTNDDMVALNADDATDRVINLGMKCGPIRDITVENLRAEDAYTFVRLLSFGELIENVTISDVTGGCRVNAINLDHWRFPAGGGNIRNVTLRNFTVRKLDGGDLAKWSNQAPLITIQSSVHGLRIENFRREPADDLPAPTLVVDNGQQNRLSLEGATSESTGNKVVLSRGGFSLLTLDSPTKGN
jgi:polygalacturonase